MDETLTPQEPAEGIMLSTDLNESKFYNVSCDCGNDDHTISVNVESDDCVVTTSFFVTAQIPFWKETFRIKSEDYDTWWKYQVKYFFNNIINRLKLIKYAIFNEEVKLESHTIMTKQQTINFAHTLLRAVEDVALAEQKRVVENKGKCGGSI